jgi:hypothetical protein
MEAHVARYKQNRRRSQSSTPAVDIAPIVDRTLTLLKNSPRGASRVDILAAMNLQSNAWTLLREAMEQSGQVTAVGRGPGLRHVHDKHLDQVSPEIRGQRQRIQRSAQLNQARVTLRTVLEDQGEINSGDAQSATGLRADPVRRLLLEMVDEGVVERSGKKRSTRYRWVG